MPTAPTTTTESTRCYIQETMKVIGGKWKLVILWHLLQKPYRFNELKRAIADVSTKVLSDQLSQLQSDQLVIRTMIPNNPPQVEYSISARGLSFQPVLSDLQQWAKKTL